MNYKLEGDGSTVVLIHGLFGNLANLAVLARELRQHYQVLSLDLRNHGLSFHHPDHNYQIMANDVITLLDHLNITQASLIGHSMGGKVAMKIAEIIPQRIEKLLVLDIAPVRYPPGAHDAIFAGLNRVVTLKPTDRTTATAILAQYIEQDNICQFLAKSLYKTESIHKTKIEDGLSQKGTAPLPPLQWRFNLNALERHYLDILDWSPIAPNPTPTLFIKGSLSDYLVTTYQSAIKQQFPNAKGHIIHHAGHWLHAEKPIEVLRAISRFLIS